MPDQRQTMSSAVNAGRNAWSTPGSEQPGQCRMVVDAQEHVYVAVRSGLAPVIQPLLRRPGSLLNSAMSQPHLPTILRLPLKRPGHLSSITFSYVTSCIPSAPYLPR
ncbi:hypothetical protein MRX96_011774 [Rhipicephalus microplus]